jgi:mRNA interferase RelE/StbE
LNVRFLETFAKDLKQIRDGDLRDRIRLTIEAVERASSPAEIPHLRKLHGRAGFYRIRLGDYRIGVSIEKDEVVFMRILNRKDIYRSFP